MNIHLFVEALSLELVKAQGAVGLGGCSANQTVNCWVVGKELKLSCHTEKTVVLASTWYVFVL